MSVVARDGGMVARVGAASRLARVAAAWPYAIVASIPAALLAPWFGATLDRDEAAYAVVARGMGDGLVPYRDLFDHKPPLVYGLYWSASLFGDGAWQPRVLAALLLGATALVVVAAMRELGFGRYAALVAGAVFGVSTSNVMLQMNANTEAFMLAPLTASFVCALRGVRTGRGRWMLAAGLCTGIAVLVKTSAVFPAAAIFVWLLARREPLVADAARLVSGAAAPVAAAALVFAALGAFDEFWYANITYNRVYTDAISLADRLTYAYRMDPGVLIAGLWLWALSAGGIVIAVRRRTPERVALLLWAAGAVLAVKSTGYELTHYYVQLLPAASLFAGVSLSAIGGLPRPGRRAFGVSLAPLFVLGGGVYATYASDGALRAEIHSRYERIYACESATPAIGAWIAARSQPGDGVWNFGRDTGIYFYANRQPATRFMYDRSFQLDPATARAALSSLEAAPPRYIVDTFGCVFRDGRPPDIAAFIAARYERAAVVEGAIIYELGP